MKTALKIVVSLLIGVLTMIFTAFIFFTCFFKEPVYIANHAASLADVTIQPAEAIRIATPFLPEHGTYIFRKDRPLILHLVRHEDWYYVMKTNYPAKTFRYYMQPAVKVHVHTGKIEFSYKRR